MKVRRTLVIGLGSSSAVTLCKLREQFAIRGQGDIPVVKTMLIDRESDQHPSDKSVYVLSLKADENPATSDRVLAAVDALIDDLIQTKHVHDLLRANIDVLWQISIELIIVGNLADDLVHSSVLELTKTIYPRIEQKQTITQPRAASLILALPVLGAAGAMDETRQHMRSCIRSINTYLQQANQLYALDAAQQAIRYVYLLEPINKEQLALPDVDALLWMTGDWLYYYLTDEELDPNTPVEWANNEAPVRFRSLGYASLFIPIEQMAAILRDWFITSAFANHLLAAPRLPDEKLQGHAPTNDEAERHFRKLAEERWQKEGLTARRIEDELRVTSRADRRVINPAQFGNAAFHQYQTLERRLATDYDRVLAEELPKLSEQQVENQRQILDRVAQSLINIRTYYLDEYENGVQAPVRTAIRMFDLLIEEFARRGEAQRQKVVAAEADIEARENMIRRGRATFWDAAQTFGTPPFLFPIASVLATLVSIPYLGWLVWFYLGQPAPAAVVVVATLLVMIGGFIVTLQRIENQKADFIKLYAERLDLVMKQQEARVLRNLYAQLTTMARTFQADIVRFKSMLQDQVDNRVDENRSPYMPVTLDELEQSVTPALQQQLYDTPRYVLEQSIIKRDDLRRWYKELFARIDGDLRDFFAPPQGRRLSAWFKEMVETSQPLPQTLRAALEGWVMDEQNQRIDRLRREPIERYLSRYDTERQKKLVEHMRNTSHVYSRLNPMANSSQAVQEQTHVRVADRDKAFIEQLFRSIGGDPPKIVDTAEPWQVVALSVLIQQPLDSFLALRDLEVGGVDAHLPDPLDPLTNTRLSTSAIVALAGPTGVLRLGQGGLGYDRIDPKLQLLRGIDHARVFTPLGDNYGIVVARLQKPTEGEHLRTIRQQVMKGLQDLAAKDPSGRTLVRTLDDYIERSSVDPNERLQIDNYIKLLVDHFAASLPQP